MNSTPYHASRVVSLSSLPQLQSWSMEYATDGDVVLVGLISNDKRFIEGTQITTSALKSIDFERRLAVTQNTTYRLGDTAYQARSNR